MQRFAKFLAAVLVGAYLLLLLVTVVADGWVDHAVEIDAPVAVVWDYGSDSTRAKDWSVFFHHITPVEGKGTAADGTVGAYRICYRNEDERGMRWDETTESITRNEHRRIRTFNLQGFPLGPIGTAQEYEVHQDYDAIDGDRTRLRFRSKLVRRDGIGNLLAWPVVKGIYVILARPAGQQVFVWNLENIKAAIEAAERGEAYDRPHPYDPSLPWEERPLRWWAANRWDVISA